jgi:hypothetical protein
MAGKEDLAEEQFPGKSTLQRLEAHDGATIRYLKTTHWRDGIDGVAGEHLPGRAHHRLLTRSSSISTQPMWH